MSTPRERTTVAPVHRALAGAALGLTVVAGALDARAQNVRVLVDPDPGVHVDVAETGFNTPGPRSYMLTWHALVGCGPAPCSFVAPFGGAYLRVVGSDGESTERVYFDRDARVVVHAAPRLRTATVIGAIGLVAALTAMVDLVALVVVRPPPTCGSFTDVHAGCELQAAMQWTLVGSLVVTTAALTPAFVLFAGADRGRVSVLPWVAPVPGSSRDALILGMRGRW